MKYTIALSLVFSFFTVTGQTTNFSYPEKVYDSLKKKGVSNFIFIERSFFGMRILDSLGGPDKYQDIFWQSANTTCFQEIKYYGDKIIKAPIKVISNSDIFSLLTSYFDSIKIQEFLPFIVKSESNGIASYAPLTPIHKGYYDLLLYSKNEVIHKSFEDSYLQDGPAGFTNLNYQYNNSTKLRLLWNKLWEIINSYSH